MTIDDKCVKFISDVSDGLLYIKQNVKSIYKNWIKTEKMTFQDQKKTVFLIEKKKGHVQLSNAIW